MNRKLFILVIVLALLCVVVPVSSAQDDGNETVEEVQGDDGAIVIEVPSGVDNAVFNDPIAAVVMMVVGALVSAVAIYIREARRIANDALAFAQNALDNSPLGFVDIRDLADDFIRAALTYHGLNTEQEQIDWAVRQIETAINTVATRAKVDLSFLIPYVRPAVNAAYHRVIEELAHLENGDDAPSTATMTLLKGNATS